MRTDPKNHWTISDRLYFGNLAVHKKTITAIFVHPILKKEVSHKFHIAGFEKYSGAEEFAKHLVDFKKDKDRFSVDKTDLTKELQLFAPTANKNTIYFYFEVCDGSKRLPLHYAAIYVSDCFPDENPNITNNWTTEPTWRQYLTACEEQISYDIYEEKIHPSCRHDLFQLFHDFGFDVYEWLDKDNPEHIDELIDASLLESYRRKFLRMKEPAMRNYALAVLNSVFEQAFADKELMKCSFCERFLDYQKGKRYCSLKFEKRDCAKKARNKRYYAQTGRQRLDSYRIATKELRAFYKEKNIKK